MKHALLGLAMSAFGIADLVAQTPAQLKDVLAVNGSNSYIPYIEINGKIFYEINEDELWVTNGTTTGSLQLKNWSSQMLTNFHEYNGSLLFFADSDNNGTAELWKSDGTVSGTVLVKNMLMDYSWTSLVPMIEVGSKYFYQINGGELWVTDGTTSGTLQLKNWTSDMISTFHEFNGLLYLFGDSDNNTTAELWKSDGTASGTVLVKNVLKDYSWSTLVPYIEIGSKVYYQINSDELWVTDGSAAGTIQLKNWSSQMLTNFHEYNNLLYFFGDSDNNTTAELWKSDGTISGTVLVKNVLMDYSWSSLVPMIEVGSKYFYQINGGELWVTDGSTTGTSQLKNWTSDMISTFHEFNGLLYLFGDSDNNGTAELWKSDGTSGGTVLVKNVLKDYSWSSLVPYLQIGSKVYYEINSDELWVTDGSAGGTIQLKNWSSTMLTNFHELSGKLMFFGDSDNNGTAELWKSDGTISGTVLVKNVLFDYSWSSYVPYYDGNTKIFYDINGGELWATDGTTTGTTMLRNFASDQMGQFHGLGSDLLFFGDDNNNGSMELWHVTNAIAAGAEMPGLAGLTVWPVPCTNILNVKLPDDASGFGMKVFDLTGRVVSENEATNNYGELNMAHLPAGVYILFVESDGLSATRRIVKE